MSNGVITAESFERAVVNLWTYSKPERPALWFSAAEIESIEARWADYRYAKVLNLWRKGRKVSRWRLNRPQRERALLYNRLDFENFTRLFNVKVWHER